MTTIQTAASPRTPGVASRIWRTVRLHFANPWTVLWTPWLILCAIFVGNFLIWLAIAVASGATQMKGTQYSGSAFFLFFYMTVIAIQAINLTFSFALGIGSTRRDYYLGSALTWILICASFATGMTILGGIETATNGWWVGGTFFNTIYFGSPIPLLRMFTIFAGLLFFSAIGAFAGSVFVRWGGAGLLAVGACAFLLVVIAVAALTLTHGWAGLWNWLLTTGSTGVMAWSLLPTVIFGALGYRVLRHATPRN